VGVAEVDGWCRRNRRPVSPMSVAVAQRPPVGLLKPAADAVESGGRSCRNRRPVLLKPVAVAVESGGR
ncbi:hypothetical protein, partial [Streptomyces tricolor]